jgi:hypothetical protein
MSGSDVLELQKILNSDPDTRIADVGIGSPGSETTYFGGLTRAAVVRFQEKNSATILVPNGLSAGTGVVGPSTRVVLNKLEQAQTVSVAASPQKDVTALSNAPSASIPTLPSYTNPNNLKNLDKMLAAIDSVSKKQGLSAGATEQAKEAALKVVATTTDLHQAFLEAAQNNISKAVFPKSPFGDALNGLAVGLRKFFLPKDAFAQAGTPFGGALLYPLYCTQTNNWLLTIQPLPPRYATLLTYQTGSQIYMTFDIPLTLELLGSYTGGSPCIEGYCPYCVTIPSEGMVSPATGSS